MLTFFLIVFLFVISRELKKYSKEIIEIANKFNEFNESEK